MSSTELPKIISREAAQSLWGPLDKRVKIDAKLDDIPTIDETMAVLTDRTREEDGLTDPFLIQGLYFVDVVKKRLSEENESFLDIVRHCAARQARTISDYREKALEELPDYLHRLGRAVTAMAKDGLLTSRQAEMVNERFFTRDGSPTIADTPVSLLEYHRLNVDGAPDGREVPYNDYFLGSIVSPAGNEYSDDIRDSLKPHESIHAWVGGLELTESNNSDKPLWPRTVGLWLGHQQAGSIATGFAANEGMAEWFHRHVTNYDQTLGPSPSEHSSYADWERTVANWRTVSPGTFAIAVNAFVAEATDEQPMAKQDAMAELDEMFTKSSSVPDEAKKLFC